MLTRSTPAQRAKILSLMLEAELDTRTITFMHRRIGVPDSAQGQSVSAYLDSLDGLQASDMITKLEQVLA